MGTAAPAPELRLRRLGRAAPYPGWGIWGAADAEPPARWQCAKPGCSQPPLDWEAHELRHQGRLTVVSWSGARWREARRGRLMSASPSSVSTDGCRPRCLYKPTWPQIAAQRALRSPDAYARWYASVDIGREDNGTFAGHLASFGWREPPAVAGARGRAVATPPDRHARTNRRCARRPSTSRTEGCTGTAVFDGGRRVRAATRSSAIAVEGTSPDDQTGAVAAAPSRTANRCAAWGGTPTAQNNQIDATSSLAN